MPDPTQETWLPVRGYEGLYEVSDLGRLRSLTRRTPAGVRRGRIRTPVRYDRYGHLRIGLYVGGHQDLRFVHHLVAEAFIGLRPEGMELRHVDGNPANNAVYNLAYGTKTENCLDSVRHGTHRNARKTHCDNGHEFTPENTIYIQGGRRCRACKNARDRRWKAQRKLGASTC